MIKEACSNPFSTDEYSSSKKIVPPNIGSALDKYKTNGILIKGLHVTNSSGEYLDYNRYKRELSELKCNAKLQASSMSYLFPEVPMYPCGNIGFLVDGEKSKIRQFFTKDIGTYRVDQQKRDIYWNSDIEKYCTKKTEQITAFKGHYRISHSEDKADKPDVTALKAYMLDGSEMFSPQDWNEVIVDYDVSCIVGLVIINNNWYASHGTDNEFSRDLKVCVELFHREFDSDMPLYSYDCKSAQLFNYSIFDC